MKKTIIILCLSIVFASNYCLSATGKPYTDQWIEGRIKGALDFNSYFDSTDVDIDVEKGVVNLTGKVPSDTESTYAESLASKFEGVTKVNNKLTVDEKLSGRSRSDVSQTLYDLTTTAIVKSRISAYKAFATSKVNVDTKNNVVSLQGTVPSGEIKDKIESIVLSTNGVIDVENGLKIANPDTMSEKVENSMVDASQTVSDIWITTKIRSLLAFSSDYTGSNVKVITNQGKVTLEGYARSKQQIDSIVEDISAVIGVKEVDNRLSLKSSIS